MPTPENQSRQKTERQLVRMQQALEKRMETARDRGHKLLQAIEQQQRHLDEARDKSHDPAAIEQLGNAIGRKRGALESETSKQARAAMELEQVRLELEKMRLGK